MARLFAKAGTYQNPKNQIHRGKRDLAYDDDNAGRPLMLAHPCGVLAPIGLFAAHDYCFAFVTGEFKVFTAFKRF